MTYLSGWAILVLQAIQKNKKCEDQMNKVVFVQAIFKKKSFGVNAECVIDGDKLSKDINKAVSILNENGYQILSMTDVTSGRYNYKTHTKGGVGEAYGYGWGYGYGYSYTEGVLIVGVKK